MNEEQFKGKWNQAKGKLKQKYADLTDDDLLYAEGKSEELLGRLQEKTGKTKEDLKKEIDSF
ncbi:MAG: general stress protein CsbD [Flavobacteriaceae bacterium CG2_30_34_30]|nr:CsbD family protein [Flavobacteriia bacterium]OIP52188.1 MAG: general stress protein CsbD [Flavobacteriaceae bacterium CG2_30_34_30]PIQ19499.1 MAG: general stress protein CsbD [Flavobacteriaceae bacterium CG18_big_fil_WC_8_21_14_2_50_34_36]PIV51779.1 MAG: general stress protein CsbD [Flavobacteriaceae bacterium CG02_land_8_20_14_3_00_34_13]PIZ09102.1 MAG: general stress protein CsbD [Flavobacteriaceae bacterium CG_4_10_14_0_8_um_filter_34_31]PJC06580.1 MAG: general stress protein CsbD [Flav